MNAETPLFVKFIELLTAKLHEFRKYTWKFFVFSENYYVLPELSIVFHGYAIVLKRWVILGFFFRVRHFY